MYFEVHIYHRREHKKREETQETRRHEEGTRRSELPQHVSGTYEVLYQGEKRPFVSTNVSQTVAYNHRVSIALSTGMIRSSMTGRLCACG